MNIQCSEVSLVFIIDVITSLLFKRHNQQVIMDVKRLAIGIILILIGIGAIIVSVYAYEGSVDESNSFHAGLRGIFTFLLTSGIVLLGLGAILTYTEIK